MSDNLSFTFPYGFPNPFSLEKFLEKIVDCNGFVCVNEKGKEIFISISERDRDGYFFALRFWHDKPKQTISLICTTPMVITTETQFRFTRKQLATFELRDYQHSSPEECYMVLTGDEEANKKFLGYLIQIFPSTDGIKEPN